MSEQMPAGRELDALVAVRVMGWRYCRTPASNTYECVLNAPERAAEMPPDFVSEEPVGRPLYPRRLPAYSTEIAAAWQVVDALTGGTGEDFSLACGRDEGGPLYWQAFFNGGTFANGDTAPQAICLAALAAKGESDA